MNKSKSTDPQIDFGFHSVIPRIVRTGHKKLTATQKWLYVCLKDLCGDRGVCFRTLEKLSEETDISEAMLSKSIYLLRDEGLINAEKKRRSSGGKPIWHISIIDIWGANAQAHPTKRSQKEYSHSEDTPSPDQENIHTVNENPKEYSHSEREYSQNAVRGNNTRSNNITEGVGEKENTLQPPEEPTQEHSSSSTHIEDETILTQYDEKERDTISLVVKKLEIPLTDTLASTIITTSRRYKQFDWRKATKEMLEYFQANKKGKVMTETWFDNDLERKIGFYQKDIHETAAPPEPSKPKPPVSASLQQYIDLQQRYMQQAHV